MLRNNGLQCFPFPTEADEFGPIGCWGIAYRSLSLPIILSCGDSSSVFDRGSSLMGHRVPTRRLSSLLGNPVVQNRLGFALNLTRALRDFQRPTIDAREYVQGAGRPR
jgi:hypothetical protein